MENPTLYRLNVDLSFVDMLNIHVYKRQLLKNIGIGIHCCGHVGTIVISSTNTLTHTLELSKK